jgi:hypothetical protein
MGVFSMVRSLGRPVKRWLLPPYVGDETIIFVHVPKAAGTTLSVVMKQVYPKETIYSIPSGLTDTREIDALLRLPDEERRKIRVLQGHFVFGLHRHLPQRSLYVTLLRDPVERVVSSYYYILKHENHFRHAEVAGGKMSLVDYAESEKLYLNDGQTQILAGAAPGIAATREMLEQARRNVEQHFAVVGLSERFDDSLALIRRCFGWPRRLYRSCNVSTNKPGLAALPPGIVEHLRGLNPLDTELYRWAEQRFDAQRKTTPDRRPRLRALLEWIEPRDVPPTGAPPSAAA